MQETVRQSSQMLESDAAIFLKRAIVARMLQKIKYQDSEVLKDCLGDFFIYEQREKLRRLGVITNWGINKTADGKNNSKRKLTAVCSHQTRIGNLDAHLI